MKNDDFKTYCCEYYHEGKWWGINITARNDVDAEDRVKKLGNLQLLGELMATIPCRSRATGFWVRAWVRLRNWAFA